MQDNLFNADHRNAMIGRYGYTEAMTITVDDLLMEATFDAEFNQREMEKDFLNNLLQQESAEL